MPHGRKRGGVRTRAQKHAHTLQLWRAILYFVHTASQYEAGCTQVWGSSSTWEQEEHNTEQRCINLHIVCLAPNACPLSSQCVCVHMRTVCVVVVVQSVFSLYRLDDDHQAMLSMLLLRSNRSLFSLCTSCATLIGERASRAPSSASIVSDIVFYARIFSSFA